MGPIPLAAVEKLRNQLSTRENPCIRSAEQSGTEPKKFNRHNYTSHEREVGTGN